MNAEPFPATCRGIPQARAGRRATGLASAELGGPPGEPAGSSAGPRPAINLRRLNKSLHRDVGYFLSGLIFIYCLSGIALNHVGDWNPDFLIHKQNVTLDRPYTRAEITPERIAEFNALVGESAAKVHDFPTARHLKIYYDNASLLLDLSTATGNYESVRRRPLFYQTNVLHRNTLKGWRWAADAFGLLLIFLTVSGWFVLKGEKGIGGRGKWLIAAGMLPPLAAVLIFSLISA